MPRGFQELDDPALVGFCKLWSPLVGLVLNPISEVEKHRSAGEGSVKESYHTKNNLNLCTERHAPLFTLLWPKSQFFCVVRPEQSWPGMRSQSDRFLSKLSGWFQVGFGWLG
jgi:hypothetical protein